MEATTVTSALSTALTSVAADMTGVVGTVLPIAAPVIGAVLVVTFGIKVFKKFTK